MLHSGVNRVLAGHQSRSRWCADWRNVIPIKDDAREGKCVDVGSENLRRAVKADVVEAEIVGEDENDVGSRRSIL